MRRWLARLLAASGAAAGKGSDFSFGAPVQNVNAPINQYLIGSATGLATARDPMISLAPTLVNRGPQEAAVKERLRALRGRRGPVPPLLVVVPSRPADCPDLFVMRFAKYDLRYFTDEENGCRYLQRLCWPYWSQNVNDIFSNLCDQLGLAVDSNRSARDAMEESLARISQSLCFYHGITARDWEVDDGALIRDWIEYVCGAWPPCPQGKLVVAFLCVELPAQPSLAVYLAELRDRQLSTPRLLVAPDMELIRRRHIDEWIGKCCQLLGDDYLAADLQVAPHRLFAEPDRPERPLEEVYEQLVKILKDVRAPAAANQPLVSR